MSILELTKQEICDKLQYEEICSQELRECLQNIQHRMKIPDPPEDRKSDEDYSNYMLASVNQRDQELSDFMGILIHAKNAAESALEAEGFVWLPDKGWHLQVMSPAIEPEPEPEPETEEDNPNFIYPEDHHN